MQKFREGTKVRWNWGQGHGTGKVTESFTEDVERRIKGQAIRRKARDRKSVV